MSNNGLAAAVLLASGFEMAAYRNSVLEISGSIMDPEEQSRIQEEYNLALELYCMTFVPTIQ